MTKARLFDSRRPGGTAEGLPAARSLTVGHYTFTPAATRPADGGGPFVNNEYADLYSAVPVEENWDPVEELTWLLQDAATAQQEAVVSPPLSEPPPDAELTGDPMENLAKITSELPP